MPVPAAGAPSQLALALDDEPVPAACVECLLGCQSDIQDEHGFTIVDRRPENIMISSV